MRKYLNWICVAVSACVMLFVCIGFVSTTSSQKKEGAVSNRASGTFEVKLAPQDDKTGQAGLGRMIIDKQLQGDCGYQ